jgi:hypothetical protein
MKPKTKNILLVIGFLVALIIAYQFSISKTIAAKQKITLLEKENIGFKDLAGMMSGIKKKEKYLDSVLKENNLQGASIQSSLLEILNRKSSGSTFIISGFNEPHYYEDIDLNITSYEFVLQGDFIAIEKAIYGFENQYNFGKISHLAFEKKRDFRKRKDYLECKVILENYYSN